MPSNADIFDPETVDAYELGVKGGLFDRRITFALAGFLSDYDKLQESTDVVLPSGVSSRSSATSPRRAPRAWS